MINQIMNTYQEVMFLKADGFDEAIIGVDEDTMRLIYSVKKCLLILITNSRKAVNYDDTIWYDPSPPMSKEDALEYFDYNVSGAYVGEKTPIWCHDNF